MKHWMIIGAISCLFLTACSNTNEANTEVQPIQEESPTSTEVKQQTTLNKQGNTNLVPVEELKKSIQTLTEKVNNTKVTGNKENNAQAYFNLKQEMDLLDDQLDIHEDQLEADYRAGAVKADQYKLQEKELDLLDNQLDQADDLLELTFGIDD